MSWMAAQRAILCAAAVEGDLELARHGVGELLAQEGVRDLLHVGDHVENFVARQAGIRRCGDVAHRVEAGFARRQAVVGQPVHEVRNPRQGNEMVLQVLARGEMTFACRIFVGNGGQSVQLGGREFAAGDLGADHLNAGLALSIAAEAQPQGTELVVGKAAGQKLVDSAAKTFDFAANGIVVLVLEVGASVKVGFGGQIGHWTNLLYIYRDYRI